MWLLQSWNNQCTLLNINSSLIWGGQRLSNRNLVIFCSFLILQVSLQNQQTRNIQQQILHFYSTLMISKIFLMQHSSKYCVQNQTLSRLMMINTYLFKGQDKVSTYSLWILPSIETQSLLEVKGRQKLIKSMIFSYLPFKFISMREYYTLHHSNTREINRLASNLFFSLWMVQFKQDLIRMIKNSLSSTLNTYFLQRASNSCMTYYSSLLPSINRCSMYSNSVIHSILLRNIFYECLLLPYHYRMHNMQQLIRYKPTSSSFICLFNTLAKQQLLTNTLSSKLALQQLVVKLTSLIQMRKYWSNRQVVLVNSNINDSAVMGISFSSQDSLISYYQYE